MANKQKTAAEIAAEKKAEAANKGGKEAEVKNLDPNKKKDKLSLDSKATMARLINDEWVHGLSVSDDIKENAAALRDAYMADVIVTDIAQGQSIVSHIIGNDEEKYNATRLVLANMGIAIPDFKALPQPSAEELKAQGITLLPAETRVLNVKANDVSKEVIEQKKKELKAAEKAITDPSKIENDEQLHDALSALMVSVKDSPDTRIQRAINFYQSYLKIQANKLEDEDAKKAELERIGNITRSDLLKEITKIVGTCPFVFGGIGKIYRDQTAQTGSPIAAFCLHRRSATNNKTGKVAHDDSFIADIVKTIIAWTCNSTIDGANQTIAEQKRAIEKHKDDKTHKVAAETTIKQMEKKIAEQNDVLNIINNPSFEIVDNLKENFKKDDKEDDGYKSARRLVKSICDTYHKGIDITTADEESLLNNCQQRAGIILNLFREGLAQNASYNEANISEIKMIEKPAEEGAAEGE